MFAVPDSEAEHAARARHCERRRLGSTRSIRDIKCFLLYKNVGGGVYRLADRADWLRARSLYTKGRAPFAEGGVGLEFLEREQRFLLVPAERPCTDVHAGPWQSAAHVVAHDGQAPPAPGVPDSGVPAALMAATDTRTWAAREEEEEEAVLAVGVEFTAPEPPPPLAEGAMVCSAHALFLLVQWGCARRGGG